MCQAGSSSSRSFPRSSIIHCTSIYPGREDRGGVKRKWSKVKKKGGWEDHTPGRRTTLFMCLHGTINKTAAAIKEFSARLLWGHCVSGPSFSVQDWRAAQDWFPLSHLLKRGTRGSREAHRAAEKKKIIWPFGKRYRCGFSVNDLSNKGISAQMYSAFCRFVPRLTIVRTLGWHKINQTARHRSIFSPFHSIIFITIWTRANCASSFKSHMQQVSGLGRCLWWCLV